MQSPTLSYQSGFGNEHASEAVPGALPQGRNSPQRAPFDLYPELISGTAFTAPRHENRRSWLYRRQPSVVAGRYQPYPQLLWTTGADRSQRIAPEPLRWHPLPLESGADLDFVDGMRTLAANGDADAQVGVASLMYVADQSMHTRAFVNAGYDITDWLRFDTDIQYNDRDSFAQNAGYPFQSAQLSPVSSL